MMNDKYNRACWRRNPGQRAGRGSRVISPAGVPISRDLLNNVASPFTLNATSFSTNRNYLTLSGTAPIAVTTTHDQWR